MFSGSTSLRCPTIDPKKQPPSEEYINETLKKCVDEKRRTVNIEKYRRLYYSKKMHFFEDEDFDLEGDEFKKKIRALCRAYLKSFVWIFDYYVNGLKDWKWAYEYHYAPLMYDFSRYISKLSESNYNKIKFKLGNPSVPFEQLLSVLPATSSNLLPSQFRPLMNNPKSSLVKNGYYPNPLTLEVDCEGKLKDHECVVELSFVNSKIINEAYEKISNQYPEEMNKYRRNKIGTPMIFSYDAKYTANYKNKFGVIKHMNVRKTNM